jgi:hypothetical protein
MDNERGKLRDIGWERWLNNVFWVYYKWYFLVGVFLLTVLVCTVVSHAARDRADMRLTYVYGEILDQTGAEQAAAWVADNVLLKDGKSRVRVKADPIPLVTESGERPAYGALADGERILYLLDEASLAFYRSLGYFQEDVRMSHLDLWLSLQDTPVRLYSLEDFPDQGYTQEQIDEYNDYLILQHQEDLASARGLLSVLRGEA